MSKTLNLKDKDSAVIFNGMGILEVYMPQQDDDEQALPSSFYATMCITLFEHEDLLKLVMNRLHEDIKKGTTTKSQES